jgi:hypothetical protein
MEDLFNLNPDDFSGKAASQARKVDENVYNPGPDQGQNGVYKSVIRFVPWAADPSKSKYKKYAAKLVNPLTNERIVIDCPSTIGKSSILWSLDLELRKLANEEPEIVKEIQKHFNRYYNYYSPVYIKRDPQNPGLEGQIKVFSYGYTIDNLIQQEINPEAELVSVSKINPFSLTEGKDFVLVVKRKTKAWRDFSSSKFMNEVSPLIVKHPTKGTDIPISDDPKVRGFISEFLKNNTPDMSAYHYKEWTDSDYEKVAEYIKAIVPYKQIIDNLVAGMKDEKMKALFTNAGSSKSSMKKTSSLDDDLEFTPASAPAKSQSLSVDLDDDDFGVASEPAKAAPAPTKSTPSTDLDDDIFSDL